MFSRERLVWEEAGDMIRVTEQKGRETSSRAAWGCLLQAGSHCLMGPWVTVHGGTSAITERGWLVSPWGREGPARQAVCGSGSAIRHTCAAAACV